MLKMLKLSLSAFLFAACAAQGNYWSWCQSVASTWTICNPNAAIDDRAADIVSRMSLDDKFAALVTAPAQNLTGINLTAYNWWSEATHGISGSAVQYGGQFPYASNTALPITMSAAFNRSLWWATGNAIGREARAFQNGGRAASTYWAPVINLVRDPRWGRNLETPGEDPFLTGQYASNFIQGMEHSKEDPYKFIQASACVKHFVANELEAWNGTNRVVADVYVTQQDLADSYLPPFADGVQEGKVSGVMCSYNSVNGVPSCVNDWLLGTVLRDTWQFDGYVTSDCDADAYVYYDHHYTNTTNEAVADILRAGTDMDCGSFMAKFAPYAYGNGSITDDDLNTVLKRLFRVRIRLGHFDPPGPMSTIGPDQVCSPEHVELARDGARQGTVLLKNSGNTLPLSLAAYKDKTAVVVGPNAFLRDTWRYYGGTPCFNNFSIAVDAIQQFIPATTGIAGVPDVGSSNTSGVAAAAAAAGAADLVILAVGSDLLLEREGLDRTVIDFSDGQKALISAVTAAAKGPVIALIFSGGAMDTTVLDTNPKIGAILHLGQPSVQVLAAGDIIFGQTPAGTPVAVAGRMSQTIYPAHYVSDVSMFDFGMRPGPSDWPPGTTPGRTHRFYTGQAVYPFGFGLSYSSWNYTVLPDPAPPLIAATSAVQSATHGIKTVDISAIMAGAQESRDSGVIGHIPPSLKAIAADFWVNVTNTGTVDSDDVVLGFLVPPGAGQNGTPLQELFGFERVHVPAGQTVTVYLGAQGRFFTQVNEDGLRFALPGEYTVFFGVKETAVHGMGYTQTRVMAQ